MGILRAGSNSWPPKCLASAPPLSYISLGCFSMSLRLGCVVTRLDKQCGRNLIFILYETGLSLSLPLLSSPVSQTCSLTRLCLPFQPLELDSRHNLNLCWLLQCVWSTARSFSVVAAVFPFTVAKFPSTQIFNS